MKIQNIFGHINRMKEDLIAKQILEGEGMGQKGEKLRRSNEADFDVIPKEAMMFKDKRQCRKNMVVEA